MTLRKIFNFSAGKCDKFKNEPKLKKITPSVAELI